MILAMTVVLIRASKFVYIPVFLKIGVLKPQDRKLSLSLVGIYQIDMSNRVDANYKKKERKCTLSKHLLCARPQTKAFLV